MSMIYIVKLRTELTNGVGDPMAVPHQETLEVDDALALVSASQQSLVKHQEQVASLLDLMKDRYVLSSTVNIQLLGFGQIKQGESPPPELEVEVQTVSKK